MSTFTSMVCIGLIAAASTAFAQGEASMPRDHSKMRGMDNAAMTTGTTRHCTRASGRGDDS